MLSMGVVDHGFDLWSGQTKDYKIGNCCFSAKYATSVLRLKARSYDRKRVFFLSILDE